MVNREIHRDQTKRQIGQSSLRWGTAKPLTSSQVARTLQVSETKVLGWLENGELGGLKTHFRWYISPQHVDVFLEARANIPQS